ncbi:hypothetical protein BU23DRAFT_152662 [Bimuria novae-zelandiae CBS 107.79]|uniref:DNA-directed RNA polymerase subunit n=1 Tax=Bimuria novae-zelandiae CBS 107.79 TaxID=1447943 RepID=A0A6A5VNQ3_9PLEO|nr:hypothetical protein BU23DRAFT_152662 [Bimuria novae-zelandiae CBS 107.79]
MLIFCPNCHNMLRVSKVPPGDPSTAAVEGRSRLECLTCPYQFILEKQLFERKTITPKQPDDALGGEGAWDNVDKTNVQCPNEKCRNFEAYWYQLQIRSADEPMTAFYKCTKCAKEWRE